MATEKIYKRVLPSIAIADRSGMALECFRLGWVVVGLNMGSTVCWHRHSIHVLVRA